MRIDPHVLTEARNRLVAAGTLQRPVHDNTPWYSLATADSAAVAARLADLLPLHRQYQRLGQRAGQALEIAIYRALCSQTQLTPLTQRAGLLKAIYRFTGSRALPSLRCCQVGERRVVARASSASRSRAVAAPRRLTCSFSSMLCTWFFTVGRLIFSCLAISLFERPLSMSATMSCSRPVSAASAGRRFVV